MIGDAAQYRELTELYSSYGDDELIALGRGIADLTETAQEALKGELAKRGLTISASEPEVREALSEDELADLRAYAELAPAECTFEFEEGPGASAAYLALTEAGIDSVVLASSSANFGLRGPRVVVAPQDAERAAAILSHPLAERFRSEAEQAPEEFDLPRCPACGSEETLLESAEPVNEWRCDDCGKTWLEEIAPSAE
jgi:rubrerythrin